MTIDRRNKFQITRADSNWGITTSEKCVRRELKNRCKPSVKSEFLLKFIQDSYLDITY